MNVQQEKIEKPTVEICYPDGHIIKWELTYRQVELYFPKLKRQTENDGSGSATFIYSSGIRATLFLPTP